MSSFEPMPGTIAKPEPATYRYEPDGSHNEPPAVRKLWTRVRWLFVLNIGLALATGFQAYFAYRTNELTKASLEETRKATEAAIIAARATENQLPIQIGQMDLTREQVAAGNESVAQQLAAQRDAMRLERRAWIAPAQPGRPLIELGKPVAASIEFMNTGQTPALRTRINHRLSVPVGFGQTFVPTFPTAQGNRSQMTLFPNVRTSSTVVSSWIVREGELAGLKNGLLRLVLFGRVEYDDIFDQPHRTDYCMVLLPNLTDFQVCEDYNYAD